MPSKSKAQHNLMAAVANNPAFAKKVGISKSVGEEFMKADKTKKFGSGGSLKATDSSENPGLSKLPTEVRNKMGYMKKGGMAKKCMKEGGMAKSDMKEDTKMDKAQDKAMIKKAFKQHDMQEHKGGKGTKLALKKGGMMKKMAMGGPSGLGQLAMRGRIKGASNMANTSDLGRAVAAAGPSRTLSAMPPMQKPAPLANQKMSMMKKGGMTKGCGYSKGGQLAKANGIATKGKTKGTMIAMRSGGKTKGKMC